MKGFLSPLPNLNKESTVANAHNADMEMRQGLQLCGSQLLLRPEAAPPSFPALPHPESGDDTEKLWGRFSQRCWQAVP